MSDILDRILPYSMWREKGDRSPGQWKVTSRHYTETSEGVLECVRLTHFAGLRGNRDHKARYMTAQALLANFIYILPEERYRRMIPGLSPKGPEVNMDEALGAIDAAHRQHVAELESRVAELEAMARSHAVFERKPT